MGTDQNIHYRLNCPTPGRAVTNSTASRLASDVPLLGPMVSGYDAPRDLTLLR